MIVIKIKHYPNNNNTLFFLSLLISACVNIVIATPVIVKNKNIVTVSKQNEECGSKRKCCYTRLIDIKEAKQFNLKV
ncbi:hypothetical protein BDA99DRAFT_509513 [Phascolomyces articulosus]|uniref:Uncharacterized protein n=1 Tax=Phascolomyces articulosus TaxID=60185 RepID=A0AAD5PE67_9FUNG|nr:hypothetical protein BDA99DRAFT_509513 [Phascolomyces articulosus]